MKKWLLPLTILVVVALVASLLWWQQNRDETSSTGDEAKPLAVTRQVERRTLTRELQITGTLERVEVETISVATQGNISSIDIEDGDRIEVGGVIFALDGRPGIAVQGDTPFFRDLDVGSRGPDVRQLENALDDFGYDPGAIDDLFTLDTRRALAAFQADRDYPASSPEVGETITMSLVNNPVAYTIGSQNAASITIDPLLNPDGPGAAVSFLQGTVPTVSIRTSSVVADEGSSAQYTLVLDAAATAPITVAIGFNGAAVPGSDFNAPVPSQITVPAGSLSTAFTIQTIQDATVETNEDLIVTVLPDPAGAGTNYDVAAAPDHEVTTDILDDDLPELNVTSSGAITEGGLAMFTITADQPVLNDTTVQLVAGLTTGLGGGAGEAAADVDYDAFPSVTTIPAGASSVNIPVQTLTDADVEGDEEVAIEIQPSPGFEVGSQNAALITIQDATAVTVPTITLEVEADEVAEGAAGQFTFRATNAFASPYDIEWTLGGSAVSGDDYDPPGTFVTTMAANATTAALNIALNDDDRIEVDRTLSVTIVPRPEYVLGAASTGQTIIEDNDVPELNVSGTTTINEGATTVVTITADQPALDAIRIPVQLAGTAQSNSDFEPIASSVTLPAGAITAQLSIQTIADNPIEPNEEVIVNLGGGNGDYTVGSDANATVTIVDSIGTSVGPILTINSSTADVSEGQQVVFTVGASVPSTREIDVNIALSGTAVNNVDFTFPTQDFVIPAGQTQVQIPVTIRQDDLLESDKQIVVTLLGGAGYTVAEPNHAHATIVDDDLAELTLEGGNVTLAEGAEAAFTIRADSPSPEPMSINYQITGSAQPGLDFETLSGTAILSAGQTELRIPIRTLNDDVIFRPTDMVASNWPGRAGKIFIEEGQSLIDGAPLFEITEDDFSIRLNVSPNQRAELSIGMIADVKIEASDLETVGEITELDENATITANGAETYEGRVDINTEFPAVDGSQAQVTIVIDEAANALAVPVAAVFMNPDGDAVRAVNLDSGELEEISVVTGLDEDGFVEIKEGLSVGDLIIIEVN